MPMNDPRLTFEEAAHTYAWDGQRQDGTTDVLREMGLIDPRRFTEEARDRGTYVHRAVVLFNDEELDTASIVPAYQGYMDGYFRWVDRCRPNIIHNECRICDPLLGYAGTADMVCGVELQTVRTLSATLSPYVLIDIKTGHVPPSVGPQTAAYAREVARAMGVPYLHRACLNLGEDGSAKLFWLENFNDEEVFLAALRLVQERRRYGIDIPVTDYTVV